MNGFKIGIGVGLSYSTPIRKSDENINYPGLIAAWSAKGKSNDDEDRAILKDLTGNGHDITLNGFAFSEMSGYGGCNYGNTIYHFTTTSHYQTILTYTPVNGILSFNITGITDLYEKIGQVVEVRRITPNNIIHYTTIKQDGDYNIEIDENVYSKIYINFGGININHYPCNVVIKMKLNYPDALVFDGVDDYGINENIPILTDYTIIAKRKLLGEDINWVISKRVNTAWGAFNFEFRNNNAEAVRSFGNNNILNLIQDDVSWQTKNSYNQNVIIPGTYEDSTGILIGSGLKNASGAHEYSNIAFYSAYLFDRSLDEQEIKSFIRKYIDPEYLLPSEIPTPDCYYDFSQGSNDDENRDTIKDYSGNGNNAVAHNFAWNEESGYKDGTLVFDGVDDYIDMDNVIVNNKFKTVFMLCNYFKDQAYLYDGRRKCAMYIDGNKMAYQGNDLGKSYINGILNTKVTCSELMNKKHLAISYNNTDEGIFNASIGSHAGKKGLYMNMALYKFLGFKEALTEEQINAIIKKYNLLDGVDEIEVS